MFRILFLTSILFVSFFSVRAGVAPVPEPTQPIKLDVIGKTSDNDVIARFHFVKTTLAETSDSIAYIFNYGTKSQIRKRERQIRKALRFHKIDEKIVKIINGGKREDFFTVIYVIPAGVVPPEP